MTLTLPKTPIIYPETDGLPMTESDIARDYLLYAIEVLEYYFRHQYQVYVSGNLYICYEQGVPDAVVSPDVFVIFGANKQKRTSYKVWEENGKTPSWVLEVTSASTRNTDSKEKPQKYAQMKVAEYFQYDPTGDYLKPHQLKGFRLVKGKYEPMPLEFLEDGVISIVSEALGLELRVISGQLRFYDPVADQLLPSYAQTRDLAILAEQQRDAEAQARANAEQQRDAAEQRLNNTMTRLLARGMTVEEVAEMLGLPIEDVQHSADSAQ